MKQKPKKQFEDLMLNRLEGYDIVFSDERFQVAMMEVIPMFINSCTDKNNDGVLHKRNIPEMFQALMFSVQRDASGSFMKSKVGQSATYIRRSVIFNCIRSGPELFQKTPLWLQYKVGGTDDRCVPYLQNCDLEKGFE